MNEHFQALIQDFAKLKGLDWTPDSLGLSFETETSEVFVLPHPRHEDRALVEVALRQLNELDQGRLAPLMLQINELARFEHDWRIVMDAEGVVLLCAEAALTDWRAENLESLLADGLERGQALQELLESALQDEGAGGQASPSPAEAVMLRG